MPLPATTRLFEIKLHGIEGLAPRYFGDIDRTVATPNLRVANQQNQDATSGSNATMMGGVYNPFRRYGYLSAANATFNKIATDTPLFAVLGTPGSWEYIGMSLSPSVPGVAPTINDAVGGNSTDANTTTATQSFTVTSSVSSMLVVFVLNGSGGYPTGVTWNGVAMTPSSHDGTQAFVSSWYLTTPLPATANIVATWASATVEKAIVAYSIAGTNSTPDHVATNSGTLSPAQLLLQPTVADVLTIGALWSLTSTHVYTSFLDQTQDVNFSTGGGNIWRISSSHRGNVVGQSFGSSLYDIENDTFYMAPRGLTVYKGSTFDATTVVTALRLDEANSVIMDMETYQHTSAVASSEGGLSFQLSPYLCCA